MGVNFSYHMEMRKIPGMSGDVDEHPASSNAAKGLAVVVLCASVSTYRAILSQLQ